MQQQKRFALSAATAGALLLAGTADAAMVGLPGEGLLVPFGAAGINDAEIERYAPTWLFTGVLIETPALIGADTLINDYTAPNTTKGGYTPPEDKGLWDGAMTVHYYMFDEKSEHVYDSTFVMSPDDVYFWTPPQATWPWVGYVVFADEAARKGDSATFVMTGQAGVAFETDWTDEIFDVPVIPLADGEDTGGIRIGNEITYSQQQLPRIDDVVPIVAGTRYSGAPGTTTTIVTGLIPVWDNYFDIESVVHMMWFSENGMHADIDYCDDEEWCVSCTDWTFNEVNMLWYEDDGLWDGVEYFRALLTCQDDDECHSRVTATLKGDICGVGPSILPGSMETRALDMGHYTGVGLALYEFASKAGVTGVNFQLSWSYADGENWLLAPMTTNGQF